jgi:hypothetical protein
MANQRFSSLGSECCAGHTPRAMYLVRIMRDVREVWATRSTPQSIPHAVLLSDQAAALVLAPFVRCLQVWHGGAVALSNSTRSMRVALFLGSEPGLALVILKTPCMMASWLVLALLALLASASPGSLLARSLSSVAVHDYSPPKYLEKYSSNRDQFPPARGKRAQIAFTKDPSLNMAVSHWLLCTITVP